MLSTNVKCKYRNIPPAEVIVRKGDESGMVTIEPGESLMDALLRDGYYISAVCGGKGRCGKCGVRILEGNTPITPEDEKVFTGEELEAGWRLSCMLRPEEDLTIAIEWNDETGFEVVSEFENSSRESSVESRSEMSGTSGASGKKEYVIAIDIGTTTIAFQLLEETCGEITGTVTAVNSQRKYGADVVSRIQASVDGRKRELQESIRKDLRDGILSLTKGSGVNIEQIARIAISGNTTMGHLLMGYDCDSLGVYPFTPVNIGFIRGGMEEIIGICGDAEVVLLPGITTYVGGDIVSGLYACDFDKSEDICLLVDLGTNGEMALGNCHKLLVTSTAAGPAFEGGNITWGMGSVGGAICSVRLNGSHVQLQTIREKAPSGICGTGVVEAVAELLREELIDETGMLCEEYFDDGFPLARTEDGRSIVLTQKDIRELQLAKAAIRAGVETLLLRYGIQKEQVARVYLAGGFGYRLDVEKAIAIGMLPVEFAGRTVAAGNSALAGAVKYLRNGQAAEALSRLVGISEEIGLSTDRDFNEYYMNSMMFDAPAALSP